jgi:adhesin/invasin
VRLWGETLEDRLAPALGNPVQSFIDPMGNTGDFFGAVVARSGNYVLVGAQGAYRSQGAAVLFDTAGDRLQMYLDPDAVNNDLFGTSVAMSGNKVLVGALGVNTFTGAAYVYDTAGQLQQTFADPNNAPGDSFGTSVAFVGNDVLVGAPGVSGNHGAAYLFDGAGNLLQTFVDPGNKTGSGDFGWSLATWANNVLVGALQDHAGRGAAYLFDTSGNLLQSYSNPGNTVGDGFGISLALSGNLLVVGTNNTGTAYLFDTTGTLLKTFTDPQGTPGDNFGSVVALSDDDILVSAFGFNFNAGAAYLFDTAGNLLQTFSDPGNSTDAHFGDALALTDTDVLLGALGVGGAGAAYDYGLPATVSALAGNNEAATVGTPFGTLAEAQVIDAQGNPVAAATVTFTETNGPNGAGATFTGGARTATATTNKQGLAYAPVLTANHTPGAFTVTAQAGAPGAATSASAVWRLTNLPDSRPPTLGNILETLAEPDGANFDLFGHDVAGSGSEVLAGADVANGTAGAAYLFSAAGSLLRTYTDPARTAGDLFGNAVAIAGNEVLVGAEYSSGLAGAAYLFDSLGNLLQSFTDPNNTAGDDFGGSVALAGNDVLIGAQGVNGQGAAYLYNTAGTLLDTFTDPNNNPGDQFGHAVALSSSNVLIGARQTNLARGAAYLYDTAGKLLQTYTAPASSRADFFGRALALAGSDVLVGAAGINGFSGAVYLFDTAGNLLESYSDPDSALGDQFGTSVAIAGNEVLVSAIGADASQGAAYLYNTAGNLLQTIADPNAVGGDGFGTSVALAGGGIIVGADVNEDQGAVYLYGSPAAVNVLAGDALAAVVGAPFGSRPSVQILDAAGNPVAGANVTFSAGTGLTGAAASFAASSSVSVTTDAQGIAVAPALTADDTAGDFSLTAAVGNEASATFFLTNRAGAPAGIAAIGGAGQNTVIGTAFAVPLAASVTDAYGNPVAGIPVLFAAPASGASAAFAALPMALTNAQGIATAPPLLANHGRGAFSVTATALGVAASTVFPLTNTAIPAAVTVTAGNHQNTTVKTAFAAPLRVRVTDGYGRPIPGISVEFATADAGGAGAAFHGSASVLTNNSGFATAPTLHANTGAGTFTVEAWVHGLSAPAQFTMTNTAGAAANILLRRGTPQSAPSGKAFGSPLQALVTDAYGNPVAGATATFTVVPAGGAGALFAGKVSVTAVSDKAGLINALAPTANSTLGTYLVTAIVNGASTPASFSLTNTALPATIRIGNGNGQSATVNQVFLTDLAVLVRDAAGNPISGAVVTFTVTPATGGAGASFGGSLTATASTSSTGLATAPALKATGTTGSFKVIATVAGLRTQLAFNLTND